MKRNNTILTNTLTINNLETPPVEPTVTGLLFYTSAEIYDYATAPRCSGLKYTNIFCTVAAYEITNRIRNRVDEIINDRFIFETEKEEDDDMYIAETIIIASDYIVNNYDEMTESEIDEYLTDVEKRVYFTLLADAVARSEHDDDNECWEYNENEELDYDDYWNDDEEEFEDYETNDYDWDSFNEDLFDDSAFAEIDLHNDNLSFFENEFAESCPVFYETLMNGINNMISFKIVKSSDELFRSIGEEFARFSEKLYMDYFA